MWFDNTVVVKASPEIVFDIVAEPQKYAPKSMVPVLNKLTAGPTGVGTRWREAVRMVPLVLLRTETEATSVEPPRLLKLRWKGPLMHGELTYKLERCAEGTRFRQQETMVTEGVLRAVDRVVGRSLARRLLQRMLDIKRLAEAMEGDPSSGLRLAVDRL